MGWITYDENGNEHLTKVHEVECEKQVFSEKTGQFMCTCDKGYCNENCKNYSGLEKLMES